MIRIDKSYFEKEYIWEIQQTRWLQVETAKFYSNLYVLKFNDDYWFRKGDYIIIEDKSVVIKLTEREPSMMPGRFYYIGRLIENSSGEFPELEGRHWLEGLYFRICREPEELVNALL